MSLSAAESDSSSQARKQIRLTSIPYHPSQKAGTFLTLPQGIYMFKSCDIYTPIGFSSPRNTEMSLRPVTKLSDLKHWNSLIRG